jgi:hypothetical protein
VSQTYGVSGIGGIQEVSLLLSQKAEKERNCQINLVMRNREREREREKSFI